MSITILCTGEPEKRAEGKYSSSEFDAAMRAELDSCILPYTGRKYNPEGKTVWIGEGRLAQDTAEQLLLPCSPIVEPLLNEIPLRSFTDTKTLYPLETWKRKARAPHHSSTAVRVASAPPKASSWLPRRTMVRFCRAGSTNVPFGAGT